MFTNSYDDDKVFYFLESIVLGCVASLAIHGGHNLAIFLTNRMNIPYNLSLTATSLGFGDNIVVLSVVFAIVLTVFIMEKAIPDLVRYIVWH